MLSQYEKEFTQTPPYEHMPVGRSEWVDICALEDICPGAGMAAIVRKHQIAIIRWNDGQTVYAISNFDPFSRAFVLARGILGDRAGVPKIASPIFKQSFSLLTGECLDDPSVRIPVFPVRIVSGRIRLDASAF